jgi:hypothetical protein
MTAALEGGEWSAARPGRTLPPGKTRYPFYRWLGGPQGRSGRAEILVPTVIRSRNVQPVVSCYTDWDTRPTYSNYSYWIWVGDLVQGPRGKNLRLLPCYCPFRNLKPQGLGNDQKASYFITFDRNRSSSSRAATSGQTDKLLWPFRQD